MNGLTTPEMVAIAIVVSLFTTALILRRAGRISYGTTAGLCALAVAVDLAWSVIIGWWLFAAFNTLCLAALVYAWWDELGWPLNRSKKRKS